MLWRWLAMAPLAVTLLYAWRSLRGLRLLDDSLGERARRRETQRMLWVAACFEWSVALLLATDGWAQFPNVLALTLTGLMLWLSPRVTAALNNRLLPPGRNSGGGESTHG